VSGYITPKGFTSADLQAALDEAAAAPSPWDETTSDTMAIGPTILVPNNVTIIEGAPRPLTSGEQLGAAIDDLKAAMTKPLDRLLTWLERKLSR
jgi:hypothetical protein